MLSSERLQIDTPEQIALEIPIAGIGSRFLALAIDTVLQFVTYALAVTALVLAGPWFASRVARLPPSWLPFFPAAAILAGFCIYWGYFAGFEILWKGQTPGKRLAGIRVIKESGRPIDVSAAVLRNLLRAIDFLPGMYAVGITCMMLNKHSRRIGDFVAGTVVVHDRPPAEIEPDWTALTGPVTPSAQAAHLTDAELVLIETYLQRRLEVEWGVRDRTAAHIAQRITERTGLRPEPGQTVDDFLEAVARQARDSARFR
jgi:uncharacterized RDD family membrane protein YckC